MGRSLPHSPDAKTASEDETVCGSAMLCPVSVSMVYSHVGWLTHPTKVPETQIAKKAADHAEDFCYPHQLPSHTAQGH